MALIGSGEVKQKLYNLFKGRLETDIIDMVYAGCNYKVEEAIPALSNMCPSIERHAEKPKEVFPKFEHSGTQYESKEPRNGPKRNTMFLLRGLPGSGKSYLANELKQADDVILSADDYFRSGTGYVFRGDKVKEAHEWNLARARDAARRADINNIFIDNTNTRSLEMLPYVSVAQQYGYNIEILIPKSPWAWNVNELERRNSHNVPRKTILKMLDRFEKDITVEMLLRKANPVKTKKESSQLSEPMDVTYTDEVRYMNEGPQSARADTIFIADDSQPIGKPFQGVYHEVVSPEISEVMGADATPSNRSGLRNDVVVRDGFADEEIETLLPSHSRRGSSVPIKKEDLQFLVECFPNYSIDILESVYVRFNGNMQRICSEIMEQPLVNVTSLRGFQFNEDDSGYDGRESNKKQGFSAQTLHETEAEMSEDAKTYFVTASPDRDSGKYVLKLDRGFISALQHRFGTFLQIEPDEVEDEDMVLPIENHIAEGILRNWENCIKAKKRRFPDRSQTEQRAKHMRSDDVEVVVRDRKNSTKVSTRQGASRKLTESSVSNGPNSQKESRAKLQGSFKPWSAVISGPPKDIQFPEPEKPRWDLNLENPEVRLYAMFPSVKKEVLDEILVAMRYDVQAAAEAVRTSLMLMPKENATSKMDALDSFGAVEDKSAPKYGRETNTEQIKSRQSPSETLSTSPQRTSPKDNESIALVDLTDNHIPGYQSLSGTSYADYRTEAQAHAAIRKEWLQKAAKAYTEKHGHAASYCAEQARKQGILMKEANKRAAGFIFLNKNSDRGDPVSFDLHGLHCDEAVEMLEEILDQALKYNLKYVDVITGRGAHSKGKVAKLRTSVLNYFRQYEYRYTKLNDGCFRVHLR